MAHPSAIASADLAGLDPRIAEAEIVVATDVDNPLCGPRGAAAVFGPQKGATADLAHALDQDLRRWSRVLAEAGVTTSPEHAGAGAPGLAPVQTPLRPGRTGRQPRGRWLGCPHPEPAPASGEWSVELGEDGEGVGVPLGEPGQRQTPLPQRGEGPPARGGRADPGQRHPPPSVQELDERSGDRLDVAGSSTPRGYPRPRRDNPVVRHRGGVGPGQVR